MTTNWYFVMCIFFWASLGVLGLAMLQYGSFQIKLWLQKCVGCLCGPMAIVGIRHWVWSHTAVIHGAMHLLGDFGGSKPIICFIFFLGVEGEATEFVSLLLPVNMCGS